MLFQNEDLVSQRRTAFLNGEPVSNILQNVIFDLWSRGSPHNTTFTDLQRHLLTIDSSLDSHLDEIFSLEQQLENFQHTIEERDAKIQRLERALEDKHNEVNICSIAKGKLECLVTGLKQQLENSEMAKEIGNLKLHLAVQDTKLREYQKNHELVEQFKAQLNGTAPVCDGAAGASSGVKRKNGD